MLDIVGGVCIIIALPLRQWLHENTSLLRYTNIAWLVSHTIYLSYFLEA